MASADSDLLRFITCGGVDDGKSTLIGRLLADSHALHDDHLEALEVDSRRFGSQGESVDYALLLDGLAAEREQGITIDVAYRFFAGRKRRFIVADTPGHEQYTRNMVTGASTAALAILLVDARKGLLTQTRRHAYIAKLLGIDRLVLAVNKMDLVGYDEAVFASIAADFDALFATLSAVETQKIPVSALRGDNVTTRSEAMAWYKGPSLLEHLESVQVSANGEKQSFRLPVQWVTRDGEARLQCGLVASGSARAGDAVRILPSGRLSKIARLVAPEGEREIATAGTSVAIALADNVDCGRGNVISHADSPLEVADQFEASLVWMSEEEMLPGRSYAIKLATSWASVTVTEIKHQMNVESYEPIPAKTLGINAIGVVNLSLDRELPFTSYAENRDLGGFIIVDRITNATVGAGMINFALRRAHNIHWQHIEVDRAAHAAIKGQKPKVIWFTGLSGSGKSTIANLVEKKLHVLGRHTYLLDGDNVRHGLNRDLGFTDADRVENVRRVGEVAKLMADAGLIVLCAFISPFRAERRMVRDLVGAQDFILVHVDAPLAEAERRDPKGLYLKARRGEISNFTGLDSPYEVPEEPELRIDTMTESAEQAAERIVSAILR